MEMKLRSQQEQPENFLDLLPVISPMASSGKLVFFFFFLAVFSSIQARESKFFSKFTRYSITENTAKKESTISSAPIQAPTSAPPPEIDQFLPDFPWNWPSLAPAPDMEFPPDVPWYWPDPAPAPAIEDLLDDPVLAPAPATAVGESDNGDGLFSEDSGTFPRKETSTTATTTTTTTTANENELLKEELDGVHFNKKYENGNYNNNGYSSNYNNKAYKVDSGNQNSNGFTSNNGDNGYKLAGESYETGNQNSGNGFTNNNGYETERQGMSDTRFVEGGN